MSLIPQNNFGPPVPAGPPQPPRQGAIARTFALMKLAGGGVVLILIIGAAEFLFAPEFKPSRLFGAFWGNVETNEIRAKQTATVDLARQQAEAAAKAQADAAKRAEIIGNTEGVKGFAAQVTDLACLAGQFFGTATNPDTRATGQTLKQACGAGDRIRNGMVQDLTGQGAGAASPPPPPAEALAKGGPQPDPGDEFAKAKQGPLFRPY
jgi:hypothetical protein